MYKKKKFGEDVMWWKLFAVYSLLQIPLGIVVGSIIAVSEAGRSASESGAS